MPITSITSDADALTMTIVADFPVSTDRLWQAWADPRQLERFWGPPTWPATFTQHDLSVGGESHYYMAGPEGQTSHGYWRFTKVEAPTLFEVEDGFADADGNPNFDLPGCTMRLKIEATEAGSRFTTTSTFPSVDAMEQMMAMGMKEGIQAALGQMDDVLADLRDYSANMAAELELIGEDQARVSRVVRGSLTQVWRAHHEADLVRTWMLGPDGWTMPVCETATAVGETYRYEWESAADGTRFGFEGEVKESEAPHREVTSEAPIGMDVTPNINEMRLIPQPGNRTRIELTITYANSEVRAMILGTGMLDGMETSYARLDALFAE